jgi:hypothetical protein
MRKLSLFVTFILIINNVFSQVNNAAYQKGVTADKNLNAILNLAPYSDGGVGFDNRYEGIKGSARLFDKLLPSYLKIKGTDYYVQLETDIDLVKNSLLFLHPKTGELLSVPSDLVSELIISYEGKELVFRTSSGSTFEKGLKEKKFFQVLKDGSFQFIKMPVKTLTEADYKGAYSPDRRYDEYETKFRYYISGADSIFHQLLINKKSLVKLFPDKKELIEKIIESKAYDNNEEMVIAVLDKF